MQPVTIFFILSGFLFAYLYYDRFFVYDIENVNAQQEVGDPVSPGNNVGEGEVGIKIEAKLVSKEVLRGVNEVAHARHSACSERSGGAREASQGNKTAKCRPLGPCWAFCQKIGF